MSRLRATLIAAALLSALTTGAPAVAAQATDAGGQTSGDGGGFNDWGLLGLLGLAGLMKRGNRDDHTRRP